MTLACAPFALLAELHASGKATEHQRQQRLLPEGCETGARPGRKQQPVQVLANLSAWLGFAGFCRLAGPDQCSVHVVDSGLIC
ncbi:hypothetical protein DQ403_03295 [Stutzerimonas zhaodongensis]|uniref:Uncharacterized protein n=1 Tax=Stutzerimonas zhaodongensis TaxID=1176257 RepID=A0A365Q0A0_9GAMM|nr:hypothetical protein [Stutzerimonas zhaodongensis]RBA62602.1 hypothetical protein DQ403_03295 [Stutzerimonas zhaodongensis]